MRGLIWKICLLAIVGPNRRFSRLSLTRLAESQRGDRPKNLTIVRKVREFIMPCLLIPIV
jgi:hypothetical protein